MQVVIVKEHFFSIGIAVLLLMTLYYGNSGGRILHSER